VRGEQYDEFIAAFVAAVLQKYPRVLLQWEDFAKHNAPRILERYRDRLCTFNDDIQGTGAVTVAGLLAATKITKSKLSEQRIVILGAGASAIGVSDQIVATMIAEGVTETEARANLWLVDSQGLVHTGRPKIDEFKQKYAQSIEATLNWAVGDPSRLSLSDVIKNVRPTILLGMSAQPGAFTEEIVSEMAKHVDRPVIFPLSNPTSKSEATPSDLMAWTDGRALIATGSPFPPVLHDGREIRIGQCNNSFIFPGVGLGVIASGARRVTEAMFVAAARVLSEFSPALHDPHAPLYPSLELVREVSRRVALEVALEAQRSGLAQATPFERLERIVRDKMWMPHYVSFKRVAS
jgi:malate dehydrogenase (oxaloacetate-decarboxylating)